MTKVKICGITNLEDALLSVKFGADALGFNFYEKSPRYIAPEKAREICLRLPPEVLKVGVFVNHDLDKIIEIAELVSLTAIQLHGDETPEFVSETRKRFSGEIIKALRVSENFKPEDVRQFFVGIDAILLDAFSKREYGGTGEAFNWEIAKKVNDEVFPRIYLAGGLSPDNVDTAIAEVKPFAVDACSCLEKEKGKKDKTLLINFISNVLFERRSESGTDNLLNVLRLSRLRPKLFLRGKSITKLCSFICGFYTAMNLAESDYDRNERLFREFDRWLGIRRGLMPHSFFAYSDYTLEKVNGDEEKAFDLFFALLEEFILEKETSDSY